MEQSVSSHSDTKARFTRNVLRSTTINSGVQLLQTTTRIKNGEIVGHQVGRLTVLILIFYECGL